MTLALVLAGGQARRLGGVDKALLPIAGRPALAWLLDRLHGQVAGVAISANADPARFAPFALPVLDDGAFAGQGPLAGLLAGLDWAAGQGTDALLTVPCDTPFVPPDLLTRLGAPPSCAASFGRAHHLVALWPAAARHALRALLHGQGRRNVAGFGASLGMRVVDFPPGAWDPFLNINTPDDLATAEAIARQQGPARGSTG